MREYVITRRDGAQYVVLLDDEDYERVVQAGPWRVRLSRCSRVVYAQRDVRIAGTWTTQFLQRFLTRAASGVLVDHENGNGLDNQRSNLRQATQSENQRNAALRKDNSSGRKGVGWSNRAKKWRARIRLHGKQTHLGLFTDKEQAHAAYRAAAHHLFGEFARTA